MLESAPAEGPKARVGALAYGVRGYKDRAVAIAARLPQRFGLALWNEWAAHPSTYRPLFDAVGALGIVRQSPDGAAALLEGLVDGAPDHDADQATDGDEQVARVFLAVDVLRDVGTVGVGKRGLRSVTNALVRTMQSSGVSPKQRRRIGLLLGDLEWAPDDLDAWIEIPPDRFLYGYNNEPQEIPHRYWIGKYPVTNLQYVRFIAGDGYARKEFWSDAGWSWRDRTGISQPRFWKQADYNNPLCPVVGVSWYEAETYCRWLGSEGIAQPADNGDPLADAQESIWQVRLPTELEWERMARGNDGRAYPWGDAEPSRDRANCERHAGGTTSVGTYPSGLADSGAADVAGNVWEWCGYSPGIHRVVRGGYWFFDAYNCRCSLRLNFRPPERFHDLGFRCARVRS
ncbi:MAG: SUMF1/EgtB/PvdO family nonheme iron enzyme [Thiohalocapsa sp.]